MCIALLCLQHLYIQNVYGFKTETNKKVERKMRKKIQLIFCTQHTHALCELESQHTSTSEAQFICTPTIYHMASNPLLVIVFAEPTGLVRVVVQGGMGAVGQLAW